MPEWMEPACGRRTCHSPLRSMESFYLRRRVNLEVLHPHERLDTASVPRGCLPELLPPRNKFTAANCEIIKFCLLVGCLCFTVWCLWKYLWSVKTQTPIPDRVFLISFTNFNSVFGSLQKTESCILNLRQTNTCSVIRYRFRFLSQQQKKSPRKK